MSLLRKSRNNQGEIQRWITLIVFSVLVALFVARLASPVFVSGARRNTITSSTSNSHRVYFDHDGPEWVYSTSRLSFHPPDVVLLQAFTSSEAQNAFETNGVHYDRPPPFL